MGVSEDDDMWRTEYSRLGFETQWRSGAFPHSQDEPRGDSRVCGRAKAKHGLQAMKGQSHHDYECGSTTPARCQWSLAVGGLWQSRWSTFDATALTPQVTRDDRKEGIPRQEMIPVLPLLGVLARKRRDVEHAEDRTWPVVLVNFTGNHNFPVSLFYGWRPRPGFAMLVI